MGQYLNPPFDPRILRIGSPNLLGRNLKRGRLIVASGSAKDKMVRKGVHFLYNPVEVAVSHTIDPNAIIDPHLQQQTDAQTQTGQLANIGGVSVSLLYDRTYELWDGSLKNTLPGKFGVYADVLAYYQLLGIVTQHTVTTKGPEIYTYNYFDQYPTHPINPAQRYYLYIGDKMRFFGTLSDFEITYSHWNQNMVPQRCAISMSMVFMTQPPNSPKVQSGKGKKVGTKVPNVHIPGV